MSEIMRETYCNGIERALVSLKERLEIRVAGNRLSLHVYAESILVSVLEPVFDLFLTNANLSEPNAPAIDLVDEGRKVLIQVTTDASRDKIQGTLNKKKVKEYDGYHLMFILLVGKHPRYRKAFDKPDNIIFDLRKDVVDLGRLMAIVQQLPMERLERAYDGIRREIRFECGQTPNLSRGLASVVKAMMVTNPEGMELEEPIAFRIEEKISGNALQRVVEDIRDMSSYTYPLEGIYAQYEAEGNGRARSIHHHLRTIYRKANDGVRTPDEVYISVIQSVVGEVEGSNSLAGYRYEDIEFYVEVVVVHAFMLCKLFEGPSVWEGADKHASFK